MALIVRKPDHVHTFSFKRRSVCLCDGWRKT